METLIDMIRAATAADATAEDRANGAQACRTILAALEATPSQPLAPAAPPATTIQAIVSALRNTPPEQLLELAITRLKAALPPGTEVSPVQTIRIPLAPVASVGGKSS